MIKVQTGTFDKISIDILVNFNFPRRPLCVFFYPKLTGKKYFLSQIEALICTRRDFLCNRWREPIRNPHPLNSASDWFPATVAANSRTECCVVYRDFKVKRYVHVLISMVKMFSILKLVYGTNCLVD